ncbi:hypothetical protein [Neobacillus sp. PS2-9]|uniref:hypothetical protein n=1 Tax=Neobacillus sp. PS2-9 TaxID=3070676 RepID=UPI0027E09CC0|nr:hypothetical protein [Neobacillus sp. PS2-9]WML58557.1 hypothetical protein RCG25_01835 [Neobacillus sp. PS2-9]
MKKKWLFWVPVGAAAIWAGSHLLPGLGHFGGHDMVQGGSGQGHGIMQGGAGQAIARGGQGRGMMQGSPKQGMMQGGRGHGMMGHGGNHAFGFDFGWSRTLVGIGIALFGVALRKQAKDKVWKKWAGYGLIGVGLVAAFKAALPVLAIGAGAYWLFKKAGSTKQKDFSTVAFAAPVVNNNSQILDAWEKNISKEEK